MILIRFLTILRALSCNLYVFILLTVCFGCREQPKSELYMKDKEHIEKAFLSNTEILRRILLHHADGFNLSNIWDNLPDSINIYSEFCPITKYWDDNKKAFFAIPVPACVYLDVEVGDISYSADSLKCMAFVTVFDKSDLYEPKENPECSYVGYAVIGLRDSKDDQFKIYPEDLISFDGFPSRRLTLILLKFAYYHLKGDITPQSGGAQYTCGINNPEFFETAHEFSRIDSLDLYWCETYMIPGGDRRPFVFYSNQDSTITKYLCGDPEPEKQAD